MEPKPKSFGLGGERTKRVTRVRSSAQHTRPELVKGPKFEQQSWERRTRRISGVKATEQAAETTSRSTSLEGFST
jgi:hypothetical protein